MTGTNQAGFIEFGKKAGWWRHGSAFQYYCRRQLFEGVPLAGKDILDVGCGDGRYSLWAGFEAASVLGLEPTSEGSLGHDPVEDFRAAAVAGHLTHVEIRETGLQDFDPQGRTWDIILIHAAINHLDEDACITLTENPSSWDSYRTIARKLRSLCRPGGCLIVVDCAKRNFFGDLGMRNPFAPTIEWHKHQQPKTWAKVLGEAGFSGPRTTWLSNSVWHQFGIIQRNRVCSYMRGSMFRLLMKAV